MECVASAIVSFSVSAVLSISFYDIRRSRNPDAILLQLLLLCYGS